jgi:hypothetical protein
MSGKLIGQTLTYTFIDPCTKEVTYFNIPIQSGTGTTIFFLGQQRYFTANDVASGAFASWINQSYADYRKVSPCGVQQGQVTQNQITSQIIGSTIQSVVGSIMSQAKSESGSNVGTQGGSEGGSDAAGKDNKNNEKKSNKNNGTNNSNGTSSSSSSNQNGGQSQDGSGTTPTTGGGNGTQGDGNTTSGGGSTGSGNSTQGGGSTSQPTVGSGSGTGSGSSTGSSDNKTDGGGSEVAGTTTMTVDAKNDRGSDNSSSGGGKGGSKGGSKGGGRSNPVIVSSDLTNAQNLDRSYTGIINVGMSQSSMTGTSSWGLNSMIWFNFKQFALTSRYTKIHYSKDHKLKLIHNFNLTGVYSYGNLLGFLGYSAILNAGKWGVTGINVSGAVSKTPDDLNLFISPSATAFYTKPFKVGKRMILSPELYVISTPLIYSSVDKVTVSDRTFSAFIGTGVDYQISKKFKMNLNYKLNMSTNPDFPILSFFLIGSKINL